MFYKNNWLTWSFDDVPNSPKTGLNSVLSLSFHKLNNNTCQDLCKELESNTEIIYDNHKNLTLFFSGGVNSQIILHVYLKLKIPLDIVIVRYNNNYNLLEVNAAEKICKNLNVDYKILDFNIDNFFENTAHCIFQKSFTVDPCKLIMLNASTMVDNTPIIGNKLPYIYRSTLNYTESATWNIKFSDEDFVYQSFEDRKIIGDWFNYSPEIILSLLENNVVKELTADKFVNYSSILLKRNVIFKQLFNNLVERNKTPGFDGIILPDSMLYFFNSFVKKTPIKPSSIDLSISNFKSRVLL